MFKFLLFPVQRQKVQECCDRKVRNVPSPTEKSGILRHKSQENLVYLRQKVRECLGFTTEKSGMLRLCDRKFRNPNEKFEL
jgi:hypothetical protein